MEKTFPIALFLFLVLSACHSKEPLFTAIPASQSGVHFNNRITETDSVNVLDLSNVYNGGGVGIGDFNNDGLQDIYFTGNQVSNKLYLNKGHFSFQDITGEAGVGGNGKWCRGVAVVDINNDGWQDLYVCASIDKNPEKRKNLLYINQGPDAKGIPHFKEMAAEYGFRDTCHSTMAAFFDYDNDGDLDMYLVVNQIIDPRTPNVFHKLSRDGSFPSSGHLYRNDWSDSLGHPVFTDVSKQAGIAVEGYGHNVIITDINRDGWKDIFVTNDYLPNDLLWINNHDGTFTDKLSDYLKHSSSNSMGSDINDINNDGLMDMVVLDMNPEDNYRKKMMLNPGSYLTYQNNDLYGYNYQYVRNTLQLNQGPRVLQNDSVGDPVFSDIGFFAGMAETDWSWTPLLVDFDNDGYRDLVITNGFPKDVTDHDFIAFRNQAYNLVSKKDLLKQIPVVKRHNYAFRNNGMLGFTDVSASWGLAVPTFSNGAAYADLDNDGALDLVINNINDSAQIYRNTARDNQKEENHFLAVAFEGNSPNRNGLGAMATIYYDHGKQQVYENTPYRGYLSTIENKAHFGLGRIARVDSLVIQWPDGKMQVMPDVPADQVVHVKQAEAKETFHFPKEGKAASSLFREITDSVNIHYVHDQRDYIDFNVQKLLPHKLSDYGPALAVGDVDGNGLEDIVCGGSAFHSAQVFLQQAGGRFIQKPLLSAVQAAAKKSDDQGMILFDADGDGDPDLFIASGGYGYDHNQDAYQDHFYLNDGKGNFVEDSSAIPMNHTSKLCVRAADFDRDGDLDLFISGRVDPWNYPKPVSSFIYRNDSKNGHIQFTDITATAAKDLVNIGMVCDALWTDFNNDGWPDLVLAGEWMPVTFLKNDQGIFRNVTASTGVDGHTGWWNSLVAGDFDHDGDIDYVVGNLGLNSFYKASPSQPVRAYAKDFDKNGIYDMITSLYIPDEKGKKREFPAETRDDLIRQVNAMRKKFPTYQSYAIADMNTVVSKEEREGILELEANDLASCYLRNDGNGKFTLMPLPTQAQLSLLNGMEAGDFDGDGNLDLLVNGNDFGTEVATGRYDALNGLLLKGDGHGQFRALRITESGIFIPGNGKALVSLAGASGRYLVAASQNRGPMKVFALKKNSRLLSLQPLDEFCIMHYRSGQVEKRECFYGNSFLSQSGHFLLIPDGVESVDITDSRGKTRQARLP